MTVEAPRPTVDVRLITGASPADSRPPAGAAEPVATEKDASAATQVAGSPPSQPKDEGTVPREKALEASRPGLVRLDYELDRDTQRVVVSIVDRDSGEIIKQIPPEQLLNTLARLVEYVRRIVDEEV